MPIAITTPTGQIGRELVRLLLEAGADLTLLVRDPGKLAPVRRDQTRVQQGDLQDAEFVRRATQGADALFWVSPPNPAAQDLHAYYDRLGDSAAAAVEANGIPYVVHISSVGAQLPDAGPVSGLGRVEARLDGTDADVLHLRCGYFMENYTMQLGTIRDHGAFFTPAPGDVPLPQIATRDIARVVADTLLGSREAGKRIRGLHGPADPTFDQAASILSGAAGRHIRHVTVPAAQARDSLLALGFSEAVAQGYVDMLVALTRPGAIAEERSPETTTPTTLAQWATGVFVPLLEGTAARQPRAA